MRLRSSGLSWVRLEDDIVILDLEGSSYLKLNASGAVLWEALANGSDRESLVEVLVGQYDVPRPDAERDVDAFLGAMRSKNLLVAD